MTEQKRETTNKDDKNWQTTNKTKNEKMKKKRQKTAHNDNDCQKKQKWKWKITRHEKTANKNGNNWPENKQT